MFHVGDFSIFIVLTDSQNAFTKYPLGFNVRSPPVFLGKVAKQLNIMANNIFKYQLPVSGNNDEYVSH